MGDVITRQGVDNDLGGKERLASRDGREAIFFTERGRAGRGKAKNLRGGAGRGTPPSPQFGAGRGRGQNLRGGEGPGRGTYCVY